MGYGGGGVGKRGRVGEGEEETSWNQMNNY